MIRIEISRFFLKKSDFVVLIKEQNISNKNSLLGGPVGSLVIVSSFCTQKIMVVLTFKIVWFLNLKWFIEICHYLSLKLAVL